MSNYKETLQCEGKTAILRTSQDTIYIIIPLLETLGPRGKGTVQRYITDEKFHRGKEYSPRWAFHRSKTLLAAHEGGPNRDLSLLGESGCVWEDSYICGMWPY